MHEIMEYFLFTENLIHQGKTLRVFPWIHRPAHCPSGTEFSTGTCIVEYGPSGAAAKSDDGQFFAGCHAWLSGEFPAYGNSQRMEMAD